MPANDGVPTVRKGQGSTKLTKEEFQRRVRDRFYDPAFESVASEIERVIDVAWDGYGKYRKSPRTR
ncbi:MAG: NADPH-dependent FMN reductase, partial [Vicinamibacterales bacterium]